MIRPLIACTHRSHLDKASHAGGSQHYQQDLLMHGMHELSQLLNVLWQLASPRKTGNWNDSVCDLCLVIRLLSRL